MTLSERNVAAQRRDWNDLAALDARWAVVSQPHGKHDGWATDAFYATGEAEVEAALHRVRALGEKVGAARALDFGSGLGRVTAALARSFSHVDGVDISPVMIAQAREAVPNPAVTFHLGDGRSLSGFDSGQFDFVYSNIVLQHIPGRRAVLDLVAEFVRVLAPTGVAVFHVPARVSLRYRLAPRRRAYHLLRACRVPPQVLYFRLGLLPMWMTAAAPAAVCRAVQRAGGALVAVDATEAGVKGVEDRVYVVRGPEASRTPDVAVMPTRAV